MINISIDLSVSYESLRK